MFVAIESLSNMDGIVSPLRTMVDAGSSLQAGTRVWSSTRRMERVYIDLETTGWSCAWAGGPRARPVVHVQQGTCGVRWYVPVF